MGNAAQVGVGLGAVGLGTLAAIAIAARVLDPRDFAAFVTWWTVTNLFALAFSLTEAYLPRVLIGGADDETERFVVARFVRLEAVMLLAMVVLAAVGASWARDRLFGGSSALVWAAVAYSVLAAAQSLQRGVAIGRGRFPVLAFQLVSDGTSRLVLCVAIAIGHGSSPVLFAAALCVSAAVGAVVAATRMRGWLAWTVRADLSVPWIPLLWLSPAILVPLVINNATVPWLSAGGRVSVHELGAFAGAVTLSRMLTLLVGAAYGPVLNPLSTAVESGDIKRFVRIHSGAMTVAAFAGVLYAGSLWLLGPWLLRIYLGPSYELGRGVFAVLAAGSAFMFLSVVEQASLVALSQWHGVAIGWLIGLGAFAIVLASSMAPVGAAALAMTAGPAVSLVVMWLRRDLWLRRHPTVVSL